ncbi:MAG: ester cyclase [Bacteroidota bacterium]
MEQPKSPILNFLNKKLVKVSLTILGIMLIVVFSLGYILSGPQDKERVILNIDTSPLIQDYWTKQEKENVVFITTFVQKIMNDHDFEYVRKEYADSPYKQHNRNIADGIEGVVQSMEESTETFMNFTYDVKEVYVDGDYVTFHSHATGSVLDRGNPNKGLNIYDTWKVKDGKIVEHWDAIQGIDTKTRFMMFLVGGDLKNDNGLF